MRDHVVSGRTFMMWLAALALLVVGFTVGRTRADGRSAAPEDFSKTQTVDNAAAGLSVTSATVPAESAIADGPDRAEDAPGGFTGYEVEVLTPAEDRASVRPEVSRSEDRPERVVVPRPPAHAPQTQSPVAQLPQAQLPRAQPAPPPAPREPESISLVVPTGTFMVIRFERTLSSHTSEAGEPFRVELTEDVAVGGRTAIPRGSVIHGTVIEADPAKKIGGRAKLVLDFQYLELPSGERLRIDAGFAERGKSQNAKDAGIIAGSVVGGAILGEAVDEGEGTAIGAVVGGVVGAVVAKETRAKRVEVPIGTVTTLELMDPVTVDVFVD